VQSGWDCGCSDGLFGLQEELSLLCTHSHEKEGGPCSNDLCVHLDPKGFIEGTYLRLPSKVTGPSGGIDYEYPKVRSLDGNTLQYDYSSGDTVTKRIDQIERSDHPMPPG
jgi:hypothetical protein